MSAKDSIHFQLRNALVKDGWTITDDPFVIEYEDVQLKADIGAEKVFAAEKNERKIAVEVKVFGGISFFNDLHRATGQYCNYRVLMKETEPDRELWLAVSEEIYESQFQRLSTRKIIEDLKIKLVVFDEQKEEIVKWER